MGDILPILQRALALAAELAGLLPVIEQNYQSIKDALSNDDDAALRRLIDDLHNQSVDNAATLEALRDPAPTPAPTAKAAK
jgi:hypothetical protein